MNPQRLHKISPDTRADDLVVTTRHDPRFKFIRPWCVLLDGRIVTEGDVWDCIHFVTVFRRQFG